MFTLFTLFTWLFARSLALASPASLGQLLFDPTGLFFPPFRVPLQRLPLDERLSVPVGLGRAHMAQRVSDRKAPVLALPPPTPAKVSGPEGAGVCGTSLQVGTG